MTATHLSRRPALPLQWVVLSVWMIVFAQAQAQTSSGESASRGSESPLVADEQTMVLAELGMAALLVACTITFVIGSISNASLARKISGHMQDIVGPQFARVGTNSGETLLKDGQSFFWFYATGRRYTSGLTVFMDLAKRMDVFSYTSSFFSAPLKDRIIFYLPLTDDFDMEPMSLFLVRKKELARLRDLNEGVALREAEAVAARVLELNGIPVDFVCMTEHGDIATALLPERIRKLVQEHGRYINSIHLAENGASWDGQSCLTKRLVRVDFSLPMKTSLLPSVLEAMTRISLHLVDAAGEVKISSAAKKKALELRKKAVQDTERRIQKKRAEEAAERRQEKKKEEEEAVGKMSREKQMKYEEKKRKKELNARMKKATRK